MYYTLVINKHQMIGLIEPSIGIDGTLVVKVVSTIFGCVPPTGRLNIRTLKLA